MYIKVGFNAGDGVNYYAVPGSMTDSMLNLPRMSNIGIPGQFVFRVDQTNITNAGLYLNISYSKLSNLLYETMCNTLY